MTPGLSPAHRPICREGRRHRRLPTRHVSAAWVKDQATRGAGPGSSLRTPASPRDGLSGRALPLPSLPQADFGRRGPPRRCRRRRRCVPGLVVLNISQLRYRTVELLRTTGPGARAERSCSWPGSSGATVRALPRPGPRGPAALRAAAAAVAAPFMPHGRPTRRRNAPAALARPVFPGPRVARRVGPRPQDRLRVPARGWP